MTTALTALHASLAVQPAELISWVVYALIGTALIGVVTALVTDDRDPSTVIAWLFVIMLLPVAGVLLYFFIGRNYRRDTPRRLERRRPAEELAERTLLPTVTANAGFTAAARARLAGTSAERVEATGFHEGGIPPLPADTVQLYVSGAEKFPALLADLAGARRYIHLMYLIWKKDELTARVTETLLERLAAGVEVHIIYDWLSCISYKKVELKRLAAAGATVVPCYRRLPRFNYRNHMKIAIVDGEIAYTGGMNMAQEYIDGGSRFAVWRDTHLRMTGPVVAPFLALFAATWMNNGRAEDLATGYVNDPVAHDPGQGTPVQVLHSSVTTKHKTIRDVFITALLTARRRIWIQSPYFVPDEPLITAMCVAAASGVDVRFMMTGVPDKRIPFYAAQAYYPQLLAAGVKVYQYKAGFLHAKTVTVDDDLCIVGTCNWDIRSIILHDEVVAVLYDKDLTRRYAENFARDITDSALITLNDTRALTTPARLRNSVVRLFSRLL